MSQGQYPPADGTPPPGRPPYEGYPDPPPGRASARVPQPEWPAQQRPDAASPSSYPAPQYAGPESPQDPHQQFRRPGQPYGDQGGFGGGPAERGGNPPGTYGAAAYPSSGQYGEPGRPSAYSDPTQYGEPNQYGGEPNQYGDPDQYGDRGSESRFGALRYDEQAGGPQPTPAKSRRGLIIGVVIAAVAVLALAAVGVTWLLSSKSSNNFAVNSCVKRSGDKAVSASCSTAGSFQIVSKVGSPGQCPDQAQPYVVLQEKGKSDQVLCLKPGK